MKVRELFEVLDYWHDMHPDGPDVIPGYKDRLEDPDFGVPHAKKHGGRHEQVERGLLKRGTPEQIAEYCSFAMHERWPEGEERILNWPNVAQALTGALSYARLFCREGWPELEDKFKEVVKPRNGKWNSEVLQVFWLYNKEIRHLDFADEIFKRIPLYAFEFIASSDLSRNPKRHPDFEAAILRDPTEYNLWVYARDYVKGRWPEAEPRLLRSRYAARYIRAFGLSKEDVNKVPRPEWVNYDDETEAMFESMYPFELHPDPEGIPGWSEMMKDPKFAMEYIRHLAIRNPRGIERTPDIEKLLIDHKLIGDCLFYWNITAGLEKWRWPEMERLIESTPQKELHQTLMKMWSTGWDAFQYLMTYISHVRKSPWPKLESFFASEPSMAVTYAMDCLKGPFWKGEDAIATDASASFNYAMKVLKKRFRRGEAQIKKSDYFAKQYKEHFKVINWTE